MTRVLLFPAELLEGDRTTHILPQFLRHHLLMDRIRRSRQYTNLFRHSIERLCQVFKPQGTLDGQLHFEILFFSSQVSHVFHKKNAKPKSDK